MSVCKKCSLEKPDSEFGKSSRGRLKGSCKECESEYQKAYYLANREKVLARTSVTSKNWRLNNKERASEANKQYRIDNAERISSRKKELRSQNKEKESEYARQYYAKNRDKRLENSRTWHAENKENIYERKKLWGKENPHIRAEYAMRRHARKLQATPSWADIDEIREFYRDAARLTLETGYKWEVDHIVPLQGKLVSGLHNQFNLRVIPKSDNAAKHNRWHP